MSEVESLFEQIKTLSPADQLRLAADLLDKARALGNSVEGRKLMTMAGSVARIVVQDITALELLERMRPTL